MVTPKIGDAVSATDPVAPLTLSRLRLRQKRRDYKERDDD